MVEPTDDTRNVSGRRAAMTPRKEAKISAASVLAHLGSPGINGEHEVDGLTPPVEIDKH